MIINHNMNSMNAHRNSVLNTTASGKHMEKLSSGLRINRAGDDAAGLAISEKMRAQVKGLNQAQRNAQDGISYIQTMEGALNEVSDMLTRAKELAVQKESTGIYTTDQIDNINLELAKLQEEITHIADTTKFNGMDMKSERAVAINDAGTLFTISSIDISSVSGIDGAKSTDIDTHIQTVTTARATLGSQQNRLEHTSNNLGTTAENLTAAESRIRDTDMAKEMSSFSSKNIITQASMAMLAQANQLPQNVLSILR